MKKRAALVLALVMLTGVLAGLMPVSAAAEKVYYYAIAQGEKVDIKLGQGETIRNDYDSSVVLIPSPVGGKTYALGLKRGETAIHVEENNAVIRTYRVKVDSRSSSTLVDVDSSTTVSYTVKHASNYGNIFPNEKLIITATVKNGTTDVSGKVLYSWALDESNGVKGDISLNAAGNQATVTVKSVSLNGQPVKVNLTVSGKTGTVSKAISSNAEGNSILAYSGSVTYYFYDKDNNNAPVSASTLQFPATFNNLGRTYTVPVGQMVDMFRSIVEATPRSITFSPEKLSVDISAGIRKSSGSSIKNPVSSGYGYRVLPNGYVIIESLENASNLAVMKPGEVQQITSDMLGSVPVNAPLMSYKVADPTIATVTETGVIYARKAGVTALEVFCNNELVIYKYLIVTEDAKDTKEENEGLVIKTASVTRTLATQKNKKFRIAANSITFNGKKIAHNKLEWSSSKTSVATVDKNGYVRIKAKGTCYIYATYTDKDGEEYTARFKVVVK